MITACALNHLWCSCERKMRFPDIMRRILSPYQTSTIRVVWMFNTYLVSLLILLHINEIHSLVFSAYCLHLLGSIWLDCSVTCYWEYNCFCPKIVITVCLWLLGNYDYQKNGQSCSMYRFHRYSLNLYAYSISPSQIYLHYMSPIFLDSFIAIKKPNYMWGSRQM